MRTKDSWVKEKLAKHRVANQTADGDGDTYNRYDILVATRRTNVAGLYNNHRILPLKARYAYCKQHIPID